MAHTQALSAFRELDTEDSGFVPTATAAAYLERMGYSEEEVAEFTYATDVNGDGVIDADEWAAAFGQHSRTPFRRGASHSAPTAGVAVAAAGGVAAPNPWDGGSRWDVRKNVGWIWICSTAV